MKRPFLFFSFVMVFFITVSHGQWRPDEMEVRVNIASPELAQQLYELQLNGDIYHHAGYALLYVTPAELAVLQARNIGYEILKEDLNDYYRNFWRERDQYHSYEEIIQEMNLLTIAYPSICKKISYGSSVEGRELVTLKISDNVDDDEYEPEVMFDGGIHGDEIGGPENLIRFAKFLCQSYGVDPYVTTLIDTREIWLYIMVNPDGRVHMSRYNNNGVDLNRDFGYMWRGEGSSTGYYSQIESKALRNCMYENQFVVHTSYHSGTVFLSYPWSYRPDFCPDQPHIHAMGMVYANSSGYTNLTVQQGYYGMYPINGSTKDSYYGIMGSVGWSMELSMNKQPPPTQIQYYYEINEPAMLAMIEHAGYGIRGLVTDAVTGEPVQAAIYVDDSYPSYNDPLVGDFHKYLVPGSYNVTAVANGYQSYTQTATVTANTATTVNFSLQPGGGHYAYRVPACYIPNNNFDDEGTTYFALGAPDDTRYSLGKAGWIILDMGKTILDGPGHEIKVFEDDSDPEGYSCYASMSMDGPWTFLGNGNGTSTFNFTPAGLSQARFIRIIDDGDGPSTGDNAGFDLDAVEALEQPPVIYLVMSGHIDDPQGNGNNRIDPGEPFDLVITLRNHGGLVASAITANLNYDSAFVAVQNPDTIAGSIAHGEQVTLTFHLSCDSLTPLEQIVMMVLNVSANEGTFQQSFPMSFTVGAIIEDWESNGFQQYPWTFTGSKPWTINFIDPYEGSYAAKSGAITHNQVSGLQITLDVIGYDDISFYRRVSSQAGGDWLKFYINNVLIDQWSGTQPWEKFTYDLSPGTYTFRWSYEKNANISQGFDGAWIDYITLPSYNIDGSLHALANAFPHSFCGEGTSQLGAYVTGGSGNYTYLWAPSNSLNHPGIQFPLASPDATTAYQVQVSDGQSTVSSNILVSIHPIPPVPFITQEGDSLISSSPNGNQWHDSNGPIEGAIYQVFHPDEEGYYLVIVTSEHGCVSEPSEPYYFLFTDISENQTADGWFVFPNPFDDRLHLRTGNHFEGYLRISISNPMGQVMISEEIHATGTAVISLPELAKGMYILSVTGPDRRLLHIQKIIR